MLNKFLVNLRFSSILSSIYLDICFTLAQLNVTSVQFVFEPALPRISDPIHIENHVCYMEQCQI
jgi:hypothetical protein